MLKISGVILCIAGCAGYGLLQVAGWKQALKELNQWILVFQKIKSRILYQKETLEESCLYLGEKEDNECGKTLRKIGKRAREERQTEFHIIWKEEMEKWCKRSMLKKMTCGLLMDFPEYAKEADEELQINLFAVYAEDLYREKEIMEKEIQEKQKPVIAVSFIGGIMISILLV